MTSINFQVFDDLLIGNFMKTTFLGDWKRNDFRYLLGIGGLLFKRGDFKNICGNCPQEIFWIKSFKGIKDYEKISGIFDFYWDI